jgi:hypothetical protein
MTSRWRGHSPTHLGAALAFVVVFPLAVANGGYNPPLWGWASVALFAGIAIALVQMREVALSRRQATMGGTFFAFCAWTGASALWSSDVTRPVLQVEHVTVYLGALVAVILIIRSRGAAVGLFGGCVAAITMASDYGLATRLFPNEFGLPSAGTALSNRLSVPLGYWNALGIFAVMGILLAVGLAARSQTWVGRGLAGSVVPGLGCTLYFTYSRGAMLALCLGIVVMFMLSRERLTVVMALVAAGLPAAVGVAFAARQASLASSTPALAASASEGWHVAVAVLALSVAAGGLSITLNVIDGNIQASPRLRPEYAVVLVALLALALLVGAATTGPLKVGDHIYTSITRAPPKGANLNDRILSLSNDNRTGYWRGALAQYRANAVLGGGAGSFEPYWLQHRGTSPPARNANSLYLETLAELGPFGVVLLLGALALPLTAARSRREPATACALAAYVAFLAHAAIDWDWQVTAVGVVAILIGAGILVIVEDADAHSLALGRNTRLAGVVVALGLSGLGFVGLMGNAAIAGASDALAAGHWSVAESYARQAEHWMPWSDEPLTWLGEARLDAGNRRGARGAFKAALRGDPDNWSAWLGLARASSGTARSHALAKAIGLNPAAPEIAEFCQGRGLAACPAAAP